MSSRSPGLDGNVTIEEGKYAFQLVQGSVQRKRGHYLDDGGMRGIAQSIMAQYLAKVTVNGKTSCEGNQIVYVHSAEGADCKVSVRAWISSVADPMDIPAGLWATHLNRYWGCSYLQNKEGAYVHIPGLLSGPSYAQLETPSEFDDALFHTLGRVNPRVSFFDIKDSAHLIPNPSQPVLSD